MINALSSNRSVAVPAEIAMRRILNFPNNNTYRTKQGSSKMAVVGFAMNASQPPTPISAHPSMLGRVTLPSDNEKPIAVINRACNAKEL
ncbi:hypothetical protein D3C72_1297240 [compost metagenome]